MNKTLTTAFLMAMWAGNAWALEGNRPDTSIGVDMFVRFVIVALISYGIIWAAKKHNRKHFDPAPCKGIGGWLQFFIWFSIVQFLSGVSGILIKSELDTVINGRFPELLPARPILLFIGVTYMLISIYSTYLLLFIKPKAIKIIKIVLPIKPAIDIISPYLASLLLLLITNQGEFDSAHFLKTSYGDYFWKGLAISITGAAVWYIYFTVSKRVKNTWPEHFAQTKAHQES